jgi:hypothetical protein
MTKTETHRQNKGKPAFLVWRCAAWYNCREKKHLRENFRFTAVEIEAVRCLFTCTFGAEVSQRIFSGPDSFAYPGRYFGIKRGRPAGPILKKRVLCSKTF